MLFMDLVPLQAFFGDLCRLCNFVRLRDLKTRPSAEVDILSNNGKWLEILGCGIVNPVVLENCNIDSNKYSGLAFGLGVERIAMLKYELDDIREFYKSNLDFLGQFK